MFFRILYTLIFALLSAQSEEQKFVEIFKASAPAVVFINTVRLELDPFELFFERGPVRGIGSGFIIDSDEGLILTNAHVILDPRSKIIVTLHGGEKIPAVLVGLDEEYDVALLKLSIKPRNKPKEVRLGSSSNLEVGRRVLAIGNPFGLDWTMTSGIVSALNRTVKSAKGYIRMIQSDAAINPGSSGGPLLDLTGSVVGINTQIVSETGNFAGVSFAIPIDEVKEILPDLKRFGRVKRPFFGWVLQDTQFGVAVRRVLRNSPAFEAGFVGLERVIQNRQRFEIVLDIESADFILEINGVPVKSTSELFAEIKRLRNAEGFYFLVRNGLDSRKLRRVFVRPIYR
mgnify:CR=1 FL=1